MIIDIPKYPTMLPMTETFRYGQDWHRDISIHLEGVLATEPNDCGVIVSAVAHAGHGDHLELGTLYGGTAILAAMTKKTYGWGGRIVCVDDFAMWSATPELVQRNAEAMGFGNQIEVIKHKTDPLPVQDRTFASTLIDAGHSYNDCWRDWLSVKDITTRVVIFHDVDDSHPGVVRAVRQVECNQKGWRLVCLAYHTAVFEHVHD